MAILATAAVARTASGRFAIEPIEIEDPRADEVLVRVTGVGLCHTDLVFLDYLPLVQPPAILGHEGSGVVERVGANVMKVAVGDHVVLSFHSCGHCPSCDRDMPAYCHSFGLLNTSGRRADGSSAISVDGETAGAHFFGQSSFATYALANERNVVPIDKDVPLELMGPLGCGVQTGAASIMKSLACRAGSSLLVLGGGAVGLSAVLGAVVQGCATIIVVEPVADRRAMALTLGATHVIDPATGDVTQAVREVQPAGVDYAFDTSGLASVMSAALGCLAPNGRLGLVGVPAKRDETLTIPINQLIATGLSVAGIIEGDADPDRFIPEMVALYRQGRFPFNRLITTYPLSEINRAIADQRAGKCIKPVMLPA